MLELLEYGNVYSSEGKVVRRGKGRGHALPLVYLKKTPHGSAVSRKAPFGGCWIIILYFQLS
jgi:hypothetical protein